LYNSPALWVDGLAFARPLAAAPHDHSLALYNSPALWVDGVAFASAFRLLHPAEMMSAGQTRAVAAYVAMV
jgi:hypothetical protein